MKVKIKQWNGVASWLWVANDENCGICRAPFNGCCPDCKVPGDDCPLVWGVEVQRGRNIMSVFKDRS
ncbi:anaphase-promoting complex subunit 11 isoform X1 [Astyanax mexicanus]|uniref:Anaphase-promoting complex subunit 11 isoform X1 n=1 Tax=Astyanax mexicanus TaxID=7994 RepID=A0A8T2M0A8_ASTMX|nr:anaphase-promoting complex subunit 11 isoform X1 [Astyanax mexicanus]